MSTDVYADEHAEQCALGGALHGLDPLAYVIDTGLEPADFYHPKHGTIFRAVLDMATAGAPVDMVTVGAELGRRGELARVGGAPYLHTLVATVPTAANASHYAQIVRAHADRRRLAEVVHRAAQRVADLADAPAAVTAEVLAELTEVAKQFTGTPGWDEPIRLEGDALPVFPTQVLGEHLGQVVCQVAASLEVPVDLPAMLALGIISIAIGGRRVVRPAEDPLWIEPVIGHVMVLMDSGEMKSPTLRIMARPVYEAQKALRAAHAQDAQDAERNRRDAELRAEHAEKTAARAKAEARWQAQNDLNTARAALDALGEPTPPPQIIVDDITPEQLIGVMERNGERAAVLSSEGSFFGNIAGRYSGGTPNVDVVLKGWGQEPHQLNRADRETYLEHPSLTVCVCPQPGMLTGLGDKVRSYFDDRGLLGRNLYALPPSLVGYRALDGAGVVDARALADYTSRIGALFATVWPSGESVMTLTTDAYRTVMAARRAWEPRRRPGGDLHDIGIAGWANKLHGQVVRLAALLALYDSPQATSVDTAHVRRALELAPYLIAHASAVADLVAGRRGTSMSRAIEVRGWIRAHVEATTGVFTVRQVHQSMKRRGWVKTGGVDALRAALAVLAEYGWVRMLEGGTRRSQRYAAWPGLWQQDTNFSEDPTK